MNNNADNNEAVPPYHAFTVGTVRFVVTDLRSEAIGAEDTNSTPQMFSDAQRQWLREEFASAADYDFVVWVTTKPWIGTANPSKDRWFGQAVERRALSEHIDAVIGGSDGPQNLLAVSGDAHMLAFDDGTNTYYGSSSNIQQHRIPFPFCSRVRWTAWGPPRAVPSSDGCYSVSWRQMHQYSTIRFELPQDEEEEACLIINAYRVRDRSDAKETMFTRRLCGQIFQPAVVPPDDVAVDATEDTVVGYCEIDYYSSTDAALLALSAGAVLVACLMSGCCDSDTGGQRLAAALCITVFVWCSWLGTLYIGIKTAYWRGVSYWNLLSTACIMLGQGVATALWIVYQRRRSALQPPPEKEPSDQFPETPSADEERDDGEPSAEMKKEIVAKMIDDGVRKAAIHDIEE